MIIDFVKNEEHIVLEDIETIEKFNINFSAFLATQSEQISFIIKKDFIKEYNKLIVMFKDASYFRSMDFDGKFTDKPILFISDFKIFMQSLPTIKKNSKKVICSFFINNEDKESVATFIAIKGDKYGTVN